MSDGHCPQCGGFLKELAPAPNDGADGPRRYECKKCPKVWREKGINDV